MGVRARDVLPTSEARAGRAEDAVRQGAEHAGLVLVHGALAALEDMAAGRILGEEELDRALAAAPAPTSRERR